MYLLQPVLQLCGLILQVGDAVVQPQVLLLQVLLLLLGFVQLRGDVATLAELLLQRTLDDGNILLDAGDIWRTEAATWNIGSTVQDVLMILFNYNLIYESH